MVRNLKTSDLGKNSPPNRAQWTQPFLKIVQCVSIIIIFILAASLWISPYNKTWAQNSICIPSDTGLLGIDSLRKYEQDVHKIQLLEEMKHNGELLTAGEFADRITSYYGTLVAVLGTMFPLFTIATYFSMKQVFESKFESKEKKIDEKQLQIKRKLKNDIRVTLRDKIYYYRERKGSRTYSDTYTSVARKAVSDKKFPSSIKAWGISQIQNCALGDAPSASPSFWISVRMNSHIIQQINRLDL